ncbi:AraC-like DNA-binding protein [Filimonas zeae]|uniref:AraC family transcriptional regulator n=1 Tax=Filimonas zeae TaxID=1737353 RepID=A0A917IUQ8_9BACT|nr:AraC family transcriptional regulator [Filimonas zeae]MDR6339410.1 AraC-like DNA-binding protein [Filimonas zeae]GGH63722.1 AraC family transcriptional regulator [Filimonas zeae]
MSSREEIQHHNLSTIGEAHRFFGLAKPQHPLISINVTSCCQIQTTLPPGPHVLGFYKISYKRSSGSVKYGQGHYDFEEGSLLFAAPNQVIGGAGDDSAAQELPGYTLLIHPDFLWNYPLGKKIRQYGFFSYAANEALYLSESERATIVSIFDMIQGELNSRIDDFSQDVVVSQLELLFNYASRFYKRQFITRKVVNNDLLQKLDDLLEVYFNKDVSLNQGLPTVQYLAEHVNLSPGYLSDMLRSLIGQNAQQYIHSKLIQKAKEQLSTTSLTVSEVAYQLGFEHSQSFSKLFKSKTNLSPLEFRKSFN